MSLRSRTPAYTQGVAAALNVFNVKTAAEDSSWGRNLLLGGLGAASLYPLLRRVRLSNNPVLRAIQEAAKGRVTGVESSAASILGKERSWMPDWMRKKILQTTRGTDDVILTAGTPQDVRRAEAFNQAVLEGPTPHMTPKQQVRGAVLNYQDPYYSRVYRGDVNPASNVVDNVRVRSDKLHEAELLQKYAPGSGPTPYGTVGDHINLTPDNIPDQLRLLQETLSKKIPGGYIIKPRNAMATGDVLQGSSDLAKIHASTGQKSKWVDDLLRHPDDYVVQERLPLVTERRLPFTGQKHHVGSDRLPVEYRVHTVGGQIVPKAMSRRYPAMGSLNPFKTWRERRQLMREIQPQLDKLPDHLKERVIMGLDVAKTGRGWKIIETNPVGGQSGFLAPDVINAPTTAPHHVYRAITGRHSKPMAAAKALGGGGALVAGAEGVDALSS